MLNLPAPSGGGDRKAARGRRRPQVAVLTAGRKDTGRWPGRWPAKPDRPRLREYRERKTGRNRVRNIVRYRDLVRIRPEMVQRIDDNGRFARQAERGQQTGLQVSFKRK